MLLFLNFEIKPVWQKCKIVKNGIEKIIFQHLFWYGEVNEYIFKTTNVHIVHGFREFLAYKYAFTDFAVQNKIIN